MRYQGKISGWKDQRGFGFITPDGGGERVFVHISAFDQGQPRPGDGALVSYELARDDKKGYRAQNVVFVGTTPARTAGSSSGKMRAFVILLLLAVFGIAGWQHFSAPPPPAENSSFLANTPETRTRPDSDQQLARAFENRRNNLQIEGQGTVSRILPDDLDGSRHQRFIVKLESGQSLLVAHNIDLAPRIDALRVGDPIMFYGEYEWNAKGGVIHWTHHDPAGRHADGWLRHGGKTYR
ncbi:MAG: DUF3465 domain-containing protein [Sulfurimicrobium sp.]|nr:DUF3465 domain-containing protein [Sulfurimicrobium sp.]